MGNEGLPQRGGQILIEVLYVPVQVLDEVQSVRHDRSATTGPGGHGTLKAGQGEKPIA